jgi:hypothetical protein
MNGLNFFFGKVSLGKFGSAKDSSTLLPHFLSFMSGKVMSDGFNGADDILSIGIRWGTREKLKPFSKSWRGGSRSTDDKFMTVEGKLKEKLFEG